MDFLTDDEYAAVFGRAVPSEACRGAAKHFAAIAVSNLWNEHDNFVKSGSDTDKQFGYYDRADEKSRDRAVDALAAAFVRLLGRRGLVRVG